MKLIKVLLVKNNLLVLALLYTLFITVAFLKPTSDFPKFDFIVNDKLVHAIIYLVLSFVWLLYASVINNQLITIKIILVILIACLFYGIIIELFQELFTNSRTADYLDVVANMIGACLGAFLFLNVKNRIKT